MDDKGEQRTVDIEKGIVVEETPKDVFVLGTTGGG